MAVFDCFSFFNEFDLLDIRLAELDEVVDYFVICESSYNYMGKKKNLFFQENNSRYKKYAHKIIYLPILSFPEGLDQFKRDAYQREQMMRIVQRAQPDDLIIHTDIDEIPTLDAIRFAKKFDGITYFSMNMYQYYFNLLERKGWWHPYAIQKKYINILDSLNREKNITENDWNFYLFTYMRYTLLHEAYHLSIPVTVRNDSGWHFTNMGGLDALEKKFHAYAHSDDPWPNLMKDRNRLKQQIDIGTRIFRFDELAEYVPVDKTFPKYILENVEYFQKNGYIRNIYDAHKTLQELFVKVRRSYALREVGNPVPQEELNYLSALRFLEFALCDEHPIPVDQNRLPQPLPKGMLVSEGKQATQSSICAWSKGRTCAEDATNALSGTPTGLFSCHTEQEQNPWWMADLESIYDISEIRVFNRIFPNSSDHEVLKRLSTLQISVSEDGKIFKTIYLHQSDYLIGGLDGKPLIFSPKTATKARFVKLSLNDFQCLHLDKVYIYKKV
ncbi:discoidin domain-containing protein [Acetobacter oryzoeni]|uniref:N-acetylglucosaminyltransferase n=1 Tax=Acetobacter oryzoeni TaxID=2500548 RepID=A0A5B9GHJ3_9PROT|nr:discoidin domain-containing protein [Acetobacter oryzoeni]MCP1202025.1 discoidin domain-containing protein [Acetobacter oryzoeni]QEE85741.1 N-acetylglucosaminyltransferase [Acetobacter oryzoeni]